MMSKMKVSLICKASLLAALVASQVTVATSQEILVDDLEVVTDVGQYKSPTDIAFSKDGTLWACDKAGILAAARSGEYDAPREVLDLTAVLCDNGERGLIGATPHFDFGVDNPYVYLTYIYMKNGNCLEDGEKGPVLRLSRFTCDAAGDLTCDIASEVIFLETMSLPNDHHNSGAVAFGKDGFLYATIGDGGASPNAQDLSNLFGTVVRLTPENTIPPGNPYSVESGFQDSVRCGLNGGQSGDENKRCQEIFAHGLRNPFRFAMNPSKSTTEFYINDVGASTWEEVSIGGDEHVGANYGWPEREGPCNHGIKCGQSCQELDKYVEPHFFYPHDAVDEGAITGGTFVPNGTWTSKYEGKYLYADFVFNAIFLMDYTGKASRTECPITSDYTPVPIMNFTDANIPAMAFSPADGALYFLSRNFGGRLHRISHVGQVNRLPQPHIKTSVPGGEVGTIIEFDATESTDPDGNSLSYEWDFDGDGVVDSTNPIDSFQYNATGTYEVTLRVRDGLGGRPSLTINIGIGSQPEAQILVPAEGATFCVGQQLLLTGSASGENIIDEDASMSWEVRQHHGSHFHPFLEATAGNRVLLYPAPSPEDFLAAENSYLEVILTVTDSLGLQTTVSRNVMPKLKSVFITAVPAGRVVLVDTYEVTTPATFVSWANHTLRLEAVDSDFVAWSDGQNQSHAATLSTGDDVFQLEARFQVPGTNAPAPTIVTATTIAPSPTSSPTPSPTSSPTSSPVTAPDSGSRGASQSILTGVMGATVMLVFLSV